jgi:hypothetical protein
VKVNGPRVALSARRLPTLADPAPYALPSAGELAEAQAAEEESRWRLPAKK